MNDAGVCAKYRAGRWQLSQMTRCEYRHKARKISFYLEIGEAKRALEYCLLSYEKYQEWVSPSH